MSRLSAEPSDALSGQAKLAALDASEERAPLGRRLEQDGAIRILDVTKGHTPVGRGPRFQRTRPQPRRP
jgi:hypothetical protein